MVKFNQNERNLIFLFNPAPDNATMQVLRYIYKLLEIIFIMKVHHIFYVVGVIFIFASVWYFAREFIAGLPDPIKLTLLIISFIVAFVLAEIFKGGDL